MGIGAPAGARARGGMRCAGPAASMPSGIAAAAELGARRDGAPGRPQRHAGLQAAPRSPCLCRRRAERGRRGSRSGMAWASVGEVARRGFAARSTTLADEALADRGLPGRRESDQPLLLEGEAGVGQDRERRGPPRAAPPAPASCGSSATRASTSTTRSLRLGLVAPAGFALRAARGNGAAPFAAALLTGSSWFAGRCSKRWRPTTDRRAAHRRGRPARTTPFRGLPASKFLSDFRGLDPRAWETIEGAPAAARRADLEPERRRKLHDALKRRCLYHWIDYPTREAARPRSFAPGCPACRRTSRGRVCERGRRAGCANADLYKLPGVGGDRSRGRGPLARRSTRPTSESTPSASR